MKIIEIEQGSPEWHCFRSEGIGSSDISALMGVSRFKNVSELYEEKVNKASSNKKNWATEKGHEVEATVRSHLEKERNIKYSPICGTNEEHPIIRGSFDGFDLSGKYPPLEIKFVGAQKHMEAKCGKIPYDYLPQIHWLMLVSGEKKLEYCSWNDDDLVTVIVEYDQLYAEKMKEKALTFWHDHILTKIPPVQVNQELQSLFDQYRLIRDSINLYEKELDIVKDKLSKLVSSSEPVSYNGITAGWYERQGSIDWQKVARSFNPTIEDNYLVQFKKIGSKYFQVR